MSSVVSFFFVSDRLKHVFRVLFFFVFTVWLFAFLFQITVMYRICVFVERKIQVDPLQVSPPLTFFLVYDVYQIIG